MTEDNRETRRNPDPHALKVAEAAQASVEPDIIILFGSRAAGDHREDSDIDLLVITDGGSRLSAEIRTREAARDHMRKHPPVLELGIIGMDRKTFDRCRRAKQHVAGQAVLYGVNMSGERLEYRYNNDDKYPDHWPETKQRIRNAEEYRHSYDEMVDRNDWNTSLTGFAAQQAVENALKGWVSTHNDPTRFGHDLEEMWERIKELEDWSDPGLAEIRESLEELLDYTTYIDPERSGGENNWLTKYAVIYRYGSMAHNPSREEQSELRQLVNRALDNVVRLIHDRSGTNDEDTYPEGLKPWEP